MIETFVVLYLLGAIAGVIALGVLAKVRRPIYLCVKVGTERADVHRFLGEPNDSSVVPGFNHAAGRDYWQDQSILVEYQGDKVIGVDVLQPRAPLDRLENLLVSRRLLDDDFSLRARGIIIRAASRPSHHPVTHDAGKRLAGQAKLMAVLAIAMAILVATGLLLSNRNLNVHDICGLILVAAFALAFCCLPVLLRSSAAYFGPRQHPGESENE
jgi:hypothetical protein